jgi:hypothetical protein
VNTNRVTAPDFKPYAKVRRGGDVSTVDYSVLAGIESVVDVNDVDGPDVSIDSGAAVSAQTIAGDQLADLPDDEEDLAAYLLRLAGTRRSWRSGVVPG